MSVKRVALKKPSERTRAVDRGGLLTRNQSAKRIGISYSEFRRREELEIYTPSKVLPNGWHMYSPEAVDRYKATVQTRIFVNQPAIKEKKEVKIDLQEALTTYSASEAVSIFTLLDNAVPLIEIVKQTRLHPRVVRTIHLDWLEMQDGCKGGMFIPSSVLEEINKMPLEGTFPISSPEELRDNLQEIVDATARCISCKRAVAAYCTVCHKMHQFDMKRS